MGGWTDGGWEGEIHDKIKRNIQATINKTDEGSSVASTLERPMG